MKTSIWLRNTEGRLFEIYTSGEVTIDIAGDHNHNAMNCGKHDLVLYWNNPRGMAMSEWEILHKSRSREEAQLIKDRVYSTLHEKSQILRQIQVLKKIKYDSILPIIDQLRYQLRIEFFKLKIDELLLATIEC